MTKVLLPVDGSAFSNRALDQVLRMAHGGERLELHLLSVQLPIDSGHARMFVSDDDIAAYHRDEGLAVLEPYRARLDAAGVDYRWHVLVGHVAETIARFAEEQQFDKVVMGTHGRTGMTHLLMGSVAQNVTRRLKIPVELVN
ncbi:MAG: universal stress protein [Thiohalocapsa sp.]|jgi:nucleotide-binding universal stress UspA family protein|uniref:universal stress protein n=1 Tax=Thiohalocapsa sp. TaxID=2497641 RepID=UPI0025EB8F1E|nr:universal stress protein [Thiohalocapsa sp.]MCG6939901.1 universal stress protein [Thiohalocapsa sp.]